MAKALAPRDRSARAPERPARGKKKRGAPPGPLPASVTMSVARVLRGEDAAGEGEGGDAGKPWGVLYRLVVLDADGRPIAPGAYTIRCHLLHLSSSGCFATREKGARITAVPLDAESSAHDFVGIRAAEASRPSRGEATRAARKAAPAEGEDQLLEYFSFELQGITYAIPRSGFVLVRSRRGGRLEVVRAPQAASGSVHGAVMPGLVSDGAGDAYVLPLPG